MNREQARRAHTVLNYYSGVYRIRYGRDIGIGEVQAILRALQKNLEGPGVVRTQQDFYDLLERTWQTWAANLDEIERIEAQETHRKKSTLFGRLKQILKGKK